MAKHRRRLLTAANRRPMCRSTYSSAAAWVALRATALRDEHPVYHDDRVDQ